MVRIEEEGIQKITQKQYNKQRERLLEIAKNSDFIIDASDETLNREIGKCCNLVFSEENLEEELMIVHATDYFPKGGEIRTSRNSNVIQGNEEYGKNFSHRNTLHFSLNHRVTANDGGDWSDMKYIIMMPFKDLDKTNLASLNEVDSYVEGNLPLSHNTLILVNEENYEELSEEQRKEYNFIKFKGDAKVAVQEALILLGKKPQRSSMHSFNNETNQRIMLNYRMELSKKLNRNLSKSHFGSVYHLLENKTMIRDRILYMLRDGRVPDTRYQEQDITFDEVEKIIGEIEDSQYGHLDFLNKYILSGIEKTENGEYRLLSDDENLERAKRMWGKGSDSIDEIYYDEYNQSYQQELEKKKEADKFREEERKKQELIEKRRRILDKKYGETLSIEEEQELETMKREYLMDLERISEDGEMAYRLNSDGELYLGVSDEKTYYRILDLMKQNERNV